MASLIFSGVMTGAVVSWALLYGLYILLMPAYVIPTNDILGSFDVPVIFITAFPERLLTGERPEPAFLITKPFGSESLKAVISQALFFARKSRPAAPAR